MKIFLSFGQATIALALEAQENGVEIKEKTEICDIDKLSTGQSQFYSLLRQWPESNIKYHVYEINK